MFKQPDSTIPACPGRQTARQTLLPRTVHPQARGMATWKQLPFSFFCRTCHIHPAQNCCGVTVPGTFLSELWLWLARPGVPHSQCGGADWQMSIAGVLMSSPLAVPDAAADGLSSPALQRQPFAITTPQLPGAKVSLVSLVPPACAWKIMSPPLAGESRRTWQV